MTYPGGSTCERTRAVAVTRVDDAVLFAVERTPCHPESRRWPDQPADRCFAEVSGEQVDIGCAEGFLRDGELSLEEPVPDESADGASTTSAVRCVVHRTPGDVNMGVGEEVTLSVDEGYRERLSRSHSRCHVVSLALNLALAHAWRKDPGVRDSLGNPDFDKLAIQSSRIREDGSEDVYRIGRHLRKAGFSVNAFDDVDGVARRVEAVAERWSENGPEVLLTPRVCALEERRTWSCALGGAMASIPCGGTHVRRLDPEDDVRTKITWRPSERQVTMVAGS